MIRLIRAVALVAALLTPSFALAQPSEAPPRVTVAQGVAIGAREGDVEMFRGLPYAAPPVGEKRWRAPAPAPPWSTPRDATGFGPICVQRVVAAYSPALATRPQSEDCLSLNVWRPAGATAAPVMVWIHGGSNTFGSGSDVFYDGTAFARRGVILVTINYRLGHLGFFGHPALRAGDENRINYGLLDQIAALAWVRDNIAALGGDPADVTVFGESAGGSAVLNLMASPPARGLFAKAIVQSGGGLRLKRDAAVADREGVQVAQALGLTGPAATPAALRALPAERFISAEAPRPPAGFGAATGGEALPEAPLEAMRGGRAARVPLIIGANSNEASLMAAYGLSSQSVIDQFGGRLPAISAAYGPAVTRDDDAFARRLYGDVVFVYPARAIAIAQARHAPVWLYFFDYVPEARRADAVGVAHAGEIPFVFDTDRTRAGLTPVSAADLAYQQGVNACFAGLALTGDPASAPLCAGWTRFDRARENWFAFGSEAVEAERLGKRELDAIGTLLSGLGLN